MFHTHQEPVTGKTRWLSGHEEALSSAVLLVVVTKFWIERKKLMFKVGQKVWDVVRGEGVVVDVKPYDCKYPVIVNFARMSAITYTEEGKDYTVHEKPSIYPYPVEVVKKV